MWGRQFKNCGIELANIDAAQNLKGKLATLGSDNTTLVQMACVIVSKYILFRNYLVVAALWNLKLIVKNFV